MNDERRVVTRNDPITVESTKGSFVANPLPWRKRIDLGNFIVQAYVTALEKLKTSLQERKERFFEAFMDWDGIFDKMYPDTGHEVWDELTFSEMIAVLVAGLDVNDLTDARYMVDPNFEPPPLPQSGVGENEDGQKTTSTEDSSSVESDQMTSTDLPDQS